MVAVLTPVSTEYKGCAMTVSSGKVFRPQTDLLIKPSLLHCLTLVFAILQFGQLSNYEEEVHDWKIRQALGGNVDLQDMNWTILYYIC